MEEKDLKAMIGELEQLLTVKDELEAELSKNKAAIVAAKEAIASRMIDEDCVGISIGGYSYSPTVKTSYSKRSDKFLQENGIDYFGTLREEGLGDLIVEYVNPRTLQSALKAYVEENGELSEGLESIVSSYEYTDLNRRKATAKGARK